MGMFGKRQDGVPAVPVVSDPAVAELREQLRNMGTTVDTLTRRVGNAESLVRSLETEQLAMHDQVRKWMRRAVAAERAAGLGAQGGVSPSGSVAQRAPAPPAARLPVRPANMRGALGRIYVRKLEEALAGAASLEPEPEPGGAPGEQFNGAANGASEGV